MGGLGGLGGGEGAVCAGKGRLGSLAEGLRCDTLHLGACVLSAALASDVELPPA